MQILLPAVAYLRMSTTQQKYSIENQLACIREYAALHGFKIVRLYADEGKSGLRIRGRTAFQNLMNEMNTGRPDFNAVLVYDVSRWGRFQRGDEAAFHEHTCQKAGVAVHYCAELFENNDSLSSSVIKAVKRVMAADFSRELSAKIFASQSRLSAQGFRQGGFAGYGLRRVAVDQNGVPQRRLEFGDRKANSAQRTILMPGPAEEVETVRRIYRLFVEDRLLVKEVRDVLNKDKIQRQPYGQWISPTVKRILTSEKYTGVNIYNKKTRKLRERQVRNSPQDWIRSSHRFVPIIEPQIFRRAQERFLALRQNSDKELLSALKELFETYGFLSGPLIDSQRDMRGSRAYAWRFGGLKKAYRLVGCGSLSRTIPANLRGSNKGDRSRAPTLA